MKKDLFRDLIMTSADDCRVSLLYCNDTGALHNVLADLDRCDMEKKTHRRHIEARIRKLNKEAKAK